jgi:hypothetical protein
VRVTVRVARAGIAGAVRRARRSAPVGFRRTLIHRRSL